MAKYIFVTGGVVSSLGKGICAASIASLLKCYGYKTRVRKLDPYLNVDPGTMSPTQHGEVFVTEDGAETDLDLGHYERFADINTKKSDNVTAGQIYSKLLAKERKGDYLGGTVQVIPHVTNLIKEFINSDVGDEDFIIYEIGGTVGDIEGLPFFEAIRQVGNDIGRENALYIHVTLVPYIKAAKELKTKPTQHSVKELRSIGIYPNILICRTEKDLPQSERDKIALFCNIDKKNVIQAMDKGSIYSVPMDLHAQHLDRQILKYFDLFGDKRANFKKWKDVETSIENSKEKVKIAIVGKYISLKESYKSLIESLNHAGYSLGYEVDIKWVNARKISKDLKELKDVSGILVPGAFGEDGSAGKQRAIEYARKNKIPYFGICFGMQMAVMEFAKNVLKLNNPYSSEFEENPKEGADQVIGLMQEWEKGDQKLKRKKGDNLGGTMRLGAYPGVLEKGSLAHKIYKSQKISERHRHRYEVNMAYKDKFEAKGFKFSGTSPDGKLPEIIELENHPFFIAVQFHPEFKSRPAKPHPIFLEFVRAAAQLK